MQDILLEVNIGGEAAKSGVDPDALPQLLETAAGCAHIRVREMCIRDRGYGLILTHF